MATTNQFVKAVARRANATETSVRNFMSGRLPRRLSQAEGDIAVAMRSMAGCEKRSKLISLALTLGHPGLKKLSPRTLVLHSCCLENGHAWKSNGMIRPSLLAQAVSLVAMKSFSPESRKPATIGELAKSVGDVAKKGLPSFSIVKGTKGFLIRPTNGHRVTVTGEFEDGTILLTLAEV